MIRLQNVILNIHVTVGLVAERDQMRNTPIILEGKTNLRRPGCMYVCMYVRGSRRLMPPDTLQPKAYFTPPGL